METSFLTVKRGPKSSDPTTGIIVIAVVCCVVGTSLGKSVLAGVLILILFVCFSLGLHYLPDPEES